MDNEIYRSRFEFKITALSFFDASSKQQVDKTKQNRKQVSLNIGGFRISCIIWYTMSVNHEWWTEFVYTIIKTKFPSPDSNHYVKFDCCVIVYVAFVWYFWDMQYDREERRTSAEEKQLQNRSYDMTKMFLLSFAACLELPFCSVEEGIRHWKQKKN